MRVAGFLLIGCLATLSVNASSAHGRRSARPGDLVPLTIVHTNDIHSHFKPDGTNGWNLGGIARIATAVRRIRAESPRTLVVDGGDWSEGHMYYNLGGGRTAVEMMDHIGYDAAVVGNHDWLNGPDQLLDTLARTPHRFIPLAANVDLGSLPRAGEFAQNIPPATIVEKDGVRIGIIGVVTYELIYDRYLEPVRITYPFPVVRRLAQELKATGNAHVVVVLSHNGLATNRLMAAIPGVDVVIHAHDHEKLSQPVTVTREGKTAYIVEAEKWGHFLGRLNLLVDKDAKTVSLLSYELRPIDDTLPEDPAVATMVRGYDRELEALYASLGESDFLRGRVGRLDIPLNSTGGRENVLGNVAADAYREATGADMAFEQIELMSGGLTPGWLSSADIMNAAIQIFNPASSRTWSLWTFRMTGETLRRIIMLLYVIQDLIPGGLPSVSGLHAVFDPTVTDQVDVGHSDEMAHQGIRLLEVGGRPVEPQRLYTAAVSNGILHALEFLEQKLNYTVERQDVRDTGIETWKALRNYLTARSPFQESHVRLGDRFQVLQPELALYPHDVRLIGGNRLEVRVRNHGAVPSQTGQLQVGLDRTPDNPADDPNILWAPALPLPALAAGAATTFTVPLNFPTDQARSRYIAIAVRVTTPRDAYDGNNSLTKVWPRP